MELNYFYRKTPKIEESLEKLEILRRVIDLLPQLPHIEENLRRESLLKSSLFSARIEGNRLKLEDISYLSLQKPGKNSDKIEIANILKALNLVNSEKAPKKLSLNFILKLHSFVLANLFAETGRLRREPSAIFNQAGIAIYMTPPPSQVPKLMNLLIEKINLGKEPALVKAAMIHFAFEKIHPFLDGNGRVGRLLSGFFLKNSGFGFRGLISLEEYFDQNRQDYYDLLNNNKKDITNFIEFFLEGLVIQAEKAIEKMKNLQTELPEDSLLPRRQEILAIIKDHQFVSFDFLKRRFLKISSSTLHYDLNQLLKKGFLKKLGVSKGVRYTLKQGLTINNLEFIQENL